MVKVSINSIVKVRLTEAGAEKLNVTCPTAYTWKAGDSYQSSLWVLAKHFYSISDAYVGSSSYFIDGIIEVEEMK